MRHSTWLADDDADIFKGVTNDEKYAEAQVKKELLSEKRKLEAQLQETNKNLKNLEEKVKIETAKKLFVSKSDFLIREQLERMEKFIVTIDKHLLDGDRDGLARAMRMELYEIQHANLYLATDNAVDILYDLGREKIYKKIKDNNADYNRTNQDIRKIEIREAKWIPFPVKESGDKKSSD
jgi:hypothetical protein